MAEIPHCIYNITEDIIAQSKKHTYIHITKLTLVQSFE